MTESAEALRILARIMAMAHLNDNQGGNATVSRTRKRLSKDESSRGTTEVNLIEKAATDPRDRLLVRLVSSNKLGQFQAVSYREM